MDRFLGFLYVILALAFYLLPTIIAEARKVRSETQIFLINLFFGWTVIGWIAALIMAFSHDTEEHSSKEHKEKNMQESSSITYRLKELADLRDSGAITDEEFEKLKKQIIKEYR